jgi:hypothetical protein
MQLNRSRLNWGVFFVVLGAVLLASHQGAIPESSLVGTWQLWPLILVGIGLGLVLSRTPAYFVGGLVVAACLGLVLGSFIAVGPQVGCGGGGGTASTVTRDGTFAGSADVSLEIQCGNANVTASNDSRWHVSATNSRGLDAEIQSSESSLSVKSGRQNDWWNKLGDDSWDVSLPTGLPTSLSVSTNAGDTHLTLGGVSLTSLSLSLNAGSLKADLTNARVSNLSVSTNVGSASVTLDGSSNVTGSISTSVGSTNLCYPSQLGVQLRASESLGSGNYSAAGMVRVGDVWQTPNYASANNKADFSVSTSVGSLTLNPAGGCK